MGVSGVFCWGKFIFLTVTLREETLLWRSGFG